MTVECSVRPLRLPSPQRAVPDAGVGRVSTNRGRRQLFFLPATVLKLGFDAPERRALLGEARGSAAAARHPFWGRLPVRVFGLAGVGFVSRRFRAVRLDDFDATAQLIEDKLVACRSYPSLPVVVDLEGRLAGVLGPDDRDRLARTVDGVRLPRSSMHGDLHFFNFVRSRDGFRIIDWEHFSGEGSFVYDYVNFMVAVERLNQQRPWAEALGALGPGHPAIRRAAELTGAPARAVLAYYLVLKIDTVVARTGGEAALSQANRSRYAAVLGRALA